jgi:hypothetical protein
MRLTYFSAIFAIAIVLISSSALFAVPIDEAVITDTFTFAQTRVTNEINIIKASYPTTYQNKFPSTTNASGTNLGKWALSDSYYWGSGFWCGGMWQLYDRTGNASWMTNARAWTDGMSPQLTDTGTHDIGMRTVYSFGKAYTHYNDTNDPGGTYRNTIKSNLATAANSLNARFNMGGVPVGGTRSWTGIEGQYPICIDNMMNLELYFMAYELNGKQTSQKVWYDNAVSHANLTIAQHLRSDGSTYHVVRHYEADNGPDKPKGSIERKNTRQGFGDETTWSRGEAWAVYGFTMTYRYTKDDASVNPQNFLNAAKATADYFIDHLPNNYTADTYNHVDGDFVPPSDFDAALGEPAGPWCDANNNGIPNEAVSGTISGKTYVDDRCLGTQAFVARDSSAAAITASGLLNLCTYVTGAERQKYFTAAESILNCLMTFKGSDNLLDYLAKDSVHQGILAAHSSYWNATQNCADYGDYMFLEALNRYEALRPLAGDANEDLTVDVIDLGLMATNYDQAGNWNTGDFNGDGVVNVIDLGQMATNYGQSKVSGMDAGLVPEPATMGLLLAGLAGVIRRKI